MYGKLVCLFQVDKIAIAKVECFLECFRDIETEIDFTCTTSSTEKAILTLADLTSPLEMQILRRLYKCVRLRTWGRGRVYVRT